MIDPSGKRAEPTMSRWGWLTVVVLLLPCASAACRAAAAAPSSRIPAVCRVWNQLGSSRNLGSGTLIDKTDDGREGLVLTCAHLFPQGVGNVVVQFEGGKSHAARLLEIDWAADLAALSIANPVARPVPVCFAVDPGARLHACGYGPRGIYRCAVAPTVGSTQSEGQVSLLIADGVRSGDSGGGVFNDQGCLVAVIWGEADGVTYASSGKPLHGFLERVLGPRISQVQQCPLGTCPRPPLTAPEADAPPNVVDGGWRQLTDRVTRLEETKQDRGDYLTRSDLAGYVQSSDLRGYVRLEDLTRLENQSTERHESILDRIRKLAQDNGADLGGAAGRAAVRMLGISGPAGWGLLGATTIGGWLIGRGLKRKAGDAIRVGSAAGVPAANQSNAPTGVPN